jgi:RNA polymerase II elongation factor ELL
MFRKLYFVSDGLRDRDKNSVTKILMQVAVLRDNTYQLIRNIWNDVQEDWPFYTEQERQLLKRSVLHCTVE